MVDLGIERFAEFQVRPTATPIAQQGPPAACPEFPDSRVSKAPQVMATPCRIATYEQMGRMVG